jgi:hypothetical protein
MNESFVEVLKNNLQLKTTDELIHIYSEHDTNIWTDQTFKIIEMILKERIGYLPEIRINTKFDINVKQYKDTYIIRLIIIVLWILAGVIAYSLPIPFIINIILTPYNILKIVTVNFICSAISGVIIGLSAILFFSRKFNNFSINKSLLIVSSWGIGTAIIRLFTTLLSDPITSGLFTSLGDFSIENTIPFVPRLTLLDIANIILSFPILILQIIGFSFLCWNMHNMIRKDITMSFSHSINILGGLVFGFSHLIIIGMGSILINISPWIFDKETMWLLIFTICSSLVYLLVIFTIGKRYSSLFDNNIGEKEKENKAM